MSPPHHYLSDIGTGLMQLALSAIASIAATVGLVISVVGIPPRS
jgi:hypothetical protein